MDTQWCAHRYTLSGRHGLGALLAALAAGTLLTPGALASQEGGQPGQQEIQREDPLARVGVTEEFSTTLDSAPKAADWTLLRETVAVRYQPGKSDKLEKGVRKHLVLHAALIEKGEVQEQYRSDAVELLPGATKFDPDFLPESSMIPTGYRISNIMALGEIEVEPGEIMTKLVREIVADMTKSAPALYLAATPPEDQVDAPHKIHPVLVQLAPQQQGGGTAGGG